MSEARSLGPIDLQTTAAGADVYRDGELIARTRGTGTVRTVVALDQWASELGRVRRDGLNRWDASTYNADKDDTYQLRGAHDTIEAAIIAVLRSEF